MLTRAPLTRARPLMPSYQQGELSGCCWWPPPAQASPVPCKLLRPQRVSHEQASCSKHYNFPGCPHQSCSLSTGLSLWATWGCCWLYVTAPPAWPLFCGGLCLELPGPSSMPGHGPRLHACSPSGGRPAPLPGSGSQPSLQEARDEPEEGPLSYT